MGNKRIFGFLAAFGKEKVEDGVQGVATFLSSIDPKTASAAQLNLLRDKRDDYAKRHVEARRALAKDQDETKEIESQIAKYRKGLAALKTQHESAPAGKKAAIMKQAGTVADSVKSLLIELEREQKEDAQAQQMVDAVEKLYDQMDDMLKQAGSKLEAAERRMKTAQADEEHAQMMAELNEGAESFGGLNVALDAMTAAADEAEANAEVTRMTEAADAGSDTNNLVDQILADAAPADESNPFDA